MSRVPQPIKDASDPAPHPALKTGLNLAIFLRAWARSESAPGLKITLNPFQYLRRG
jgi:hypothetical protein